MKKLTLILVAVFSSMAGAAASLLLVRAAIQNTPAPEFHEHADFALFINNERFDFSKPEYQSNQPCTVSSGSIKIARAHGLNADGNVHLHNNNGSVVHVHAQGVTWHDFFESLDMQFEDNLLIIGETNYSSEGAAGFLFYVNGEQVSTLADREIRDLDQVLISYNTTPITDEQVQSQLATVENSSCLYSEACVHRGPAPLEACGAVYAPPKALQWLGIE